MSNGFLVDNENEVRLTKNAVTEKTYTKRTERQFRDDDEDKDADADFDHDLGGYATIQYTAKWYKE